MVTIKVGNGGAGIVGFVQYMYNKFNEVKETKYNFEWITSDTEETLNGLSDKSLDMGWPYGIDRVCKAYYSEKDDWTAPAYIFRDHFLLAGPKSNAAGLTAAAHQHPHVPNDEVYSMFKTISEGKNGTLFLTRDDLSATNVLEREIFKTVLGRYPNTATDKWYIALTGKDHYPDSALEESNKNDYYTLSDRGIWTWADANKKNNLRIFAEAGDDHADDVLLNACLVVAQKDSTVAVAFYNWLKGDGQNYIETFKLHGDRLFSKAPKENELPCKN